MALLQEILVPLLAVNDTTLTVVEIALSTGAKINKGDLLMVLETSKTTYDVEAETSGYIQYLCETDKDYTVNEVVARIYSEEAEALAPAETRTPQTETRTPPAATSIPSPAGATAASAGSILCPLLPQPRPPLPPLCLSGKEKPYFPGKPHASLNPSRPR